jgi:two-component system sensor histidine kinase KdpD
LNTWVSGGIKQGKSSFGSHLRKGKTVRKSNLYKIFIWQARTFIFSYTQRNRFAEYFPLMNYIPVLKGRTQQYLISVILVLAISGICMGIASFLGYRVVAFILLLTVSLIAMLFDIGPVLVAAVLSAFIWNFFFIPPRFTFNVQATEDVIFFIMYFVIALINAALSYKIRQMEKAARKKEEKVSALKLYDTLLHSLSHELRTPISTIIAATDNLQAGNGDLSLHNKQQLVTEIARASFRLNQQVENLLNMSRLETGVIKPKLDWCDINDLVYGVVRKVEDNKVTNKIHIHINPNLPLIKSDKMMMEQILYNLINNACLYTPGDSEINVSATTHADVFQIIVEDNGNGFPENEIENVFDKFYRLGQSRTGGTGLGLSIVRGFTEALKGKVSLKNVSTGGARFTVEIPCELSYLTA